MRKRPHWLRFKQRRDNIKKHRVIIRAAAVRAFMARPRRNFNEYRDKSLDWLQRRVEALPIRPPIWKRLRKEQRVGFIAGTEVKKFCFWFDMGMGKTLLAIALARFFKRLGTARRVLVLIPNKINKYEWATEIKKHAPASSYTILKGSTERKWEQLREADTTFILETYGGLVRLMCKPVKATGKRTTKLKPNSTRMKHLLAMVQGIVMDESIHIIRKKKQGSLVHRLCRHIAKKAEFAFELNGTPFGRDPVDMWGQFHVIDQGETLGETLALFRAAFYKAKENNYGGLDYEFDKSKEKVLNRVIGHRSIRYEADESTLPRVNYIVKPVSLPQDAVEFYEQAKKRIIAAKGNYQELQNAFLRMRQISSGFVGYDDDELGERAQYELSPNPKMEQLLSLVEEITPSHKFVIFHDFTFSGNMIEREMKRLGVPHARLYGKTKDPDVQVARFHEQQKYRVFILQNASGGFGLDRLKVARYGAYYESPVGTVLRVQTGRRIRRQGSKFKRVFLYDLIVRGTVDQQILDAHAEGIDLFKAVVEGKARIT